jgi:UDP-glucuronate decarboxylase
MLNRIIKDDINSIIHYGLEWKQLKNKHILITGANGFLPSYLVLALYEANNYYSLNLKITGLVRNKRKALKKFSSLNKQSFQFLIQDVTEKVQTNDYTHIIHAASQASPKFYGIDPIGTLKPNIIGTVNLLDMAVEQNLENFTYFSSSEVYGQVQDINNPINESEYGYLDPTLFRSCYAESKRMGETICISYFKQHQIPIKIIRPFHTYGPGMDLDDGRVYADFVKSIVSKNNIILSSDGSAKRAFCYISDATIGFLTVFLSGHIGEAYNVGNEKEEYSILELANLLVNEYKELNLKVQYNNSINNSYISSKILRNCPDCTKISQLGWIPKTKIVEGFTRTINSFS